MTVSSGDAHPWPIYNARYRVVFPILDADGDLVTGASTPDSEASQDQGTFADCTNEATEIATSSGIYYLDLTAAELDTKCTAIIVKTATAGAKTTPIVLYPRRFPVLRTGTAQAGAATTITLDSNASAKDDFYNGCYVNITNNSPANAQGQARRITDYVGSTKVATVEAAWGTNPSSASTFEILLPDDIGGDPKMWVGSAIADPTNNGVPETDVTHWLGTAAATPTVAGVPEVDVTHFNGTAGTFASGRPEVNTSHVAGTAQSAGNIIGRMGLPGDLGSGATLAANLFDIEAQTDDIGAAGAGLTALATQASVNTIDDFLDTEIAAIKAKTDQLTFTVANQVDANIQSVNDVTVTGTGAAGNEWGP